MTALAVAALRAQLEASSPPTVIDVCRSPAFRGSRSLPRAASVVVYCVHGHEVSQGAAAALQKKGIEAFYLEGGLEAWKAAKGRLDTKPREASTRWVTRERPKIDPIACRWLIARFVDAHAEFLYVPSKEVLDVAKQKAAVPYDVADVHFTHDGPLCSFDAFIRHYRLTDPALAELAVIVRGADTARLDLAPQAPGLAAISLGLSRNFADDHEMLAHGMVMYDALYTWCKSGKQEVHTWDPKAYR